MEERVIRRDREMEGGDERMSQGRGRRGGMGWRRELAGRGGAAGR